MVFLIENDVEGIVTRAVTAHIDDPSVAIEASALLHYLGMHTRAIERVPATIPASPPPLPSPDSATSMPVIVVGSVTVDAVTKASADANIS